MNDGWVYAGEYRVRDIIGLIIIGLIIIGCVRERDGFGDVFVLGQGIWFGSRVQRT